MVHSCKELPKTLNWRAFFPQEIIAPSALQDWLTKLAVQPSPFWALIFGTPIAGKTTQAQLLARRYGVTATTLDQLLQVWKSQKRQTYGQSLITVDASSIHLDAKLE